MQKQNKQKSYRITGLATKSCGVTDGTGDVVVVFLAPQPSFSPSTHTRLLARLYRGTLSFVGARVHNLKYHHTQLPWMRFGSNCLLLITISIVRHMGIIYPQIKVSTSLSFKPSSTKQYIVQFSLRCWFKCFFTSTETVGLLGTYGSPGRQPRLSHSS